jgi:hypothetical protein
VTDPARRDDNIGDLADLGATRIEQGEAHHSKRVDHLA